MTEGLSALEEFRRLLADMPKGMAGSVELVARQLSPLADKLLRCGAIPHSVDWQVIRVLLPEVPEDELQSAADELRPLSFVIRSVDGVMLHDEVRRYLFGQWLDSHERDSEKWGEFKSLNRDLVAYYEKLAEGAKGEAHAVAERQRIFHLTGADRAKGFAAFERLCRSERYRFRLESCEALIKLMREYEPIYSARQRSGLDYHAAKLDIDLHHYDKAVELLDEMLTRESVKDSPALYARCLFRLGSALMQLRSFERARDCFERLRAVATEHEEVADQELRALHGLGSLFSEMKELDKAQEILGEAVMLAEAGGRRDAMATAWNALGILRRKLNQPKRALEAFQTALKHLEEGGEAFRPRQVYNNIGLLYADRAEWPPARDHLERSCEIAREAGDMNGEATALSNLGRVYLALDRPAEAQAAAERAIQLFRNVHNWYGMAMTKRGMARYFRREGRLAEARAHLVEAREILLKAGAEDRAREIEAEIEKLDTGTWGWLRWLLVSLGVLVGAIVVMAAVVSILEEF